MPVSRDRFLKAKYPGLTGRSAGPLQDAPGHSGTQSKYRILLKKKSVSGAGRGGYNTDIRRREAEQENKRIKNPETAHLRK